MTARPANDNNRLTDYNDYLCINHRAMPSVMLNRRPVNMYSVPHSTNSNPQLAGIQFIDAPSSTPLITSAPHPVRSPVRSKSQSNLVNQDQQQPYVPSVIHDPTTSKMYLKQSMLGKGGFAWCYQVKDVETHQLFACKVISKTRLRSIHDITKVSREIQIHSIINHPNVVYLYSSFEDDYNVYMLIDLCPQKSLVQVLSKCKVLSEAEARCYVRQLLHAIIHLLRLGILHRDLKLGNMLLKNSTDMKLTDFGLADYWTGHSNDSMRRPVLCGTPNYIAPEVLQKQGHSPATEAWSVGCVLYAMLEGVPPFESGTLGETYELVQTANYPLPIRSGVLARDLIQRLLWLRVESRITLHEALNHPFLADATIMPQPSGSSVGYFTTSDNSRGTTASSSSTSTSPPSVAHSNSSVELVPYAAQHLYKMHTSAEIIPMLHEIVRQVDSSTVLCLRVNDWQFRASQLPPPSPLPVFVLYVVKWMDYSNKYGVGVQFSDGSQCVNFTDKMIMCQAANAKNFLFCENASRSTWYSVSNSDQLSALLDEKLKIFNYFSKYMDSELMRAHTSDDAIMTEVTSETPNFPPIITHYCRLPGAVLFVMSHHALQLNFVNQHTKLIIWRRMMTSSGSDQQQGRTTLKFDWMLSFVDQSRQLSTYHLCDLPQLAYYAPETFRAALHFRSLVSALLLPPI